MAKVDVAWSNRLQRAQLEIGVRRQVRAASILALLAVLLILVCAGCTPLEGDQAPVQIEEKHGVSSLALTPTPTPPSGAGSATVLLVDVSGSMSEADPTGKAKIDAARDAAENIVNMIATENQVQAALHQVALVTFSDRAYVLQPLTTDLESVRTALADLSPQSSTNMAHGVRMSNRALDSVGGGLPRLILLLSDGVPTVLESGEGPSGSGAQSYQELKQEVLAGPVAEAAAAGNCIHTIGFGDPADCEPLDDGSQLCAIDRPFLEEVARATGCGAYHAAADAHELSRIYVQLRHETLGTVVDQFSGTVRQDETTTERSVEIPRNQAELHVTLSWPGSRLDVNLVDPRGRRVDASYPGATIATYARMAYLIVNDPIPGVWHMAVHGVEVSEAFEEFDAILSVRPYVGRPPSDATAPVLIFLLVLVMTGGLSTAIVLTRRSSRRRHVASGAVPARPTAAARRRPPRAGVHVAGMQGVGAYVLHGQLYIGRDPEASGRSGNCLALTDPRVSRRHARIVRTPHGYLIEDLNSTNGTYVNEQRVPRQVLRHGDRIQIGNSRLVFWVQE